jgi:DNA-binding FadR family transcriptional regulator
MGLVEVKRGVGAIVTRVLPTGEATERSPVETPRSAQGETDQGGVLLRLERATILDILEAREVLEVQIVALAAERITPEEAEWLREASERNDSWEDNCEFHTLLASITHNFMLERLVVMQLDLLRDARQRTHYESPSNAERLLREHGGIADAVIAHDVERAQNLMREHFRHTRHSVVSGGGGSRKEERPE